MVAHIYNSSTEEAEMGKSEVKGHPGLNNEMGRKKRNKRGGKGEIGNQKGRREQEKLLKRTLKCFQFSVAVEFPSV